LLPLYDDALFTYASVYIFLYKVNRSLFYSILAFLH
jgi:hypothetical protein